MQFPVHKIRHLFTVKAYVVPTAGFAYFVRVHSGMVTRYIAEHDTRPIDLDHCEGSWNRTDRQAA